MCTIGPVNYGPRQYYCLIRPPDIVALLRGTILNRTYGTHKNLPGMYFANLNNKIWSYLLWFPAIVWGSNAAFIGYGPSCGYLGAGVVTATFDLRGIVSSRTYGTPKNCIFRCFR